MQYLKAVWPDGAIYCTLDTFSKPVQQLFCQNYHILGNFCKGVKIVHFSSEIIFGQLLDIWQFFTGHTA